MEYAGWHENPHDEAAAEALQMARGIGDRVEVSFHVTNLTLEETKTSLRNKANRLRNNRWGSNLINAALELGVSGLFSDYLNARARQSYSGTVDEYIELLCHDLFKMVEDRSINVVMVDEDAYSMRQDVVDGINAQREYEKGLAREDRKPYDLHRHDMILYHYVADQQPVDAVHFLDGDCIVLTLDRRLLGYDRHRCREAGGRAVCVHPSTLLQGLRFWTARSDEYADALFSTVRLPLLSGTELAETERLSFRILERLSSFDGIEGVSEQAITAALVDEGVRDGFRAAKTVDEETALVEAAFVKWASEKEREAAAEKERADQIARVAAGKDAAISDKNTQLIERDNLVGTLKVEVSSLSDQKRGLAVQLDSTQAEKERQAERAEAAEKREGALRWVLHHVVGMGLAAIVAGGVVGLVICLTTDADPAWVYSSTIAACILLWVMYLLLRGRRHPVIADTPAFVRTKGYFRWVLGVLGLIVVGVFANLVYQVIRDVFGF